MRWGVRAGYLDVVYGTSETKLNAFVKDGEICWLRWDKTGSLKSTSSPICITLCHALSYSFTQYNTISLHASSHYTTLHFITHQSEQPFTLSPLMYLAAPSKLLYCAELRSVYRCPSEVCRLLRFCQAHRGSPEIPEYYVRQHYFCL